jgi:hypothetical protein
MEKPDSFRERNKAVTSELLVTRSVRLSVYNFSPNLERYIIKMLTKQSELNVHKGGFFKKKIYAYFDDIERANMAMVIIWRVGYCATRVRRGTFGVSHLVKDTRIVS